MYTGKCLVDFNQDLKVEQTGDPPLAPPLPSLHTLAHTHTPLTFAFACAWLNLVCFHPSKWGEAEFICSDTDVT